jgi:hypothetical protein
VNLYKLELSLNKITKEDGATTTNGQSFLYRYAIPIAYIVFPTPISSPMNTLPNLEIPNSIPFF